MLNIGLVLSVLFPSVPRQLRAEIQTPVVGARGSASAAGQTPGPVTSTPAGPGQTATPQPVRGGGSPEGGDGRHPSFGPPPSSGPPTCERLQSEPVHPSCRYLLEDRHLAHLLSQWGATS